MSMDRASNPEYALEFEADMAARANILELLATEREIGPVEGKDWKFIVNELPTKGGLVQARQDMEKERTASRRDVFLAAGSVIGGLAWPMLFSGDMWTAGISAAAVGVGCAAWRKGRKVMAHTYGIHGESVGSFEFKDRHWSFTRIPHPTDQEFWLPSESEIDRAHSHTRLRNARHYGKDDIRRLIVARHYSNQAASILARYEGDCSAGSEEVKRLVKWKKLHWPH